jgi:GH15 family glucan-1,4-alpha-glucosidase
MPTSCSNATTAPTGSLRSRYDGYLPIEDYGLIGNLRTAALIGMDGSCDFLCWSVLAEEDPNSCTHAYNLVASRPDFDSPSVFCRLLDKNKGGHFSISPPPDITCTTKQSYLPSSNILHTRYINEDGVAGLVDFFPRVSNWALSCLAEIPIFISRASEMPSVSYITTKASDIQACPLAQY